MVIQKPLQLHNSRLKGSYSKQSNTSLSASAEKRYFINPGTFNNTIFLGSVNISPV
jgi:hypothetical protein